MPSQKVERGDLHSSSFEEGLCKNFSSTSQLFNVRMFSKEEKNDDDDLKNVRCIKVVVKGDATCAEWDYRRDVNGALSITCPAAVRD